MWLASLVRQTGDRPCGVLLQMLGVSCRLIGAAEFVEEGAGAIDTVLLLARPAPAVTVMTRASLS